jgi:hypothetical protein
MRIKLGNDQREFLDKRLQQLSQGQPNILLLRDRLLRIGGCHLVAPAKSDPDLEALLQEGETMTGEIRFEEMARNSCHWNVASLWRNEKGGILGIGTGYALSEDGLWRQHSWGITAAGILETTELRHTYYGVRLEGDKADRFSAGYEDLCPPGRHGQICGSGTPG